MNESDTTSASAADHIPISPSLDIVVEAAQVPQHYSLVDFRTLQICAPAIVMGVTAGVIAQILVALIALVTNISFYGRVSLSEVSPAPAVEKLGWIVVLIPVIGGVVVGFMARFGSQAIRGHGIPEAMEQILTNQSRIPARVLFLKPLSAAISIGTGGPFGAEGPIIATGGALGSVIGQIFRTTAAERKTLLAAGAAAGMAAIFGSPVSAVLLAIELLLFEYRPRSIIPVALAAATATCVRNFFVGSEPVFAMPAVLPPGGIAIAVYIAVGGLMGFVAVLITRAVYAIEDTFDRLPIHWMWWPAIGAIAVGTCGFIAPDTLGVGYYNISNLLSGKLAASAIAFLCLIKFVSWSIALGSGTSGGTLAPLLTIGGALGALFGEGFSLLFPAVGLQANLAALIGMAALFAGASRAMLASALFAFETTLQPTALLPLLGGCAAAYLVSSLLMHNSIMTEKIARRGVHTPGEYLADVLDQVRVSDIASRGVVSLLASDTVADIRKRISLDGPDFAHQGFPVVEDSGSLLGVVTRRQISAPVNPLQSTIGSLITGPVKFVYEDCSVRQAADHMANHQIGRLPVVSRSNNKLVGMITRSDILGVFQRRTDDHMMQEPSIRLSRTKLRRATPRSKLT